MNSKNQKIIVSIDDNKYLNWKIALKTKLKMLNSNNLEINCKNLDLSCRDISEVISIANQSNCKVLSFCSTSSKTIVSSHSLGYKSRDL